VKQAFWKLLLKLRNNFIDVRDADFQRGLPVCTENSDSNVLVMQAADQGIRYDASGALNRARDGRVLV